MKLKKQKSNLGRDVSDKDKKRRSNKQKARKQQNDENAPITKKKDQKHSLEVKFTKKKSSSFVEKSTNKSKKKNIVKLKKKKAVFVEESSNLKEKDAEKIGKKRKRPWRQVVRNKAKRERLILERGEEEENNENEEENGHEKEVDKPSAIAKKKKKRSREKRLKNKQRLLAKIGNDGEGEEEIEENLLKKDAKSRLDASRFRYINEKLYTQPSTSAVQLFNEDPEAFKTYHRGYKEQLKKWPVNPLQTIILDLSTMEKGSVIADLGCGEAELAKKLGDQFQVHSFDLVATNELTVVADMAKLPLASNSVDVCVYCLSLMGTNLAHFFREAYRILKKSGKLKIAEVASRFQNVKSFVAALNRMGFQLKRRKEIGDGFFIILTLQKVGKIENKRPLGLQLLPCLYKKR